jgi:hypothetical protein
MTALKEIKRIANGEEVTKVKLINGELIKGVIKEVKSQTLIIETPNQGAGSPTLTIPFPSILYVSDCEISS